MLALIGGIYAIGALAVLAWFVVDVWSADSTIDRLLQFALVAAGGCGVWFVASALENLGVRQPHRSAPR